MAQSTASEGSVKIALVEHAESGLRETAKIGPIIVQAIFRIMVRCGQPRNEGRVKRRSC